jgi:hypothetical protein
MSGFQKKKLGRRISRMLSNADGFQVDRQSFQCCGRKWEHNVSCRKKMKRNVECPLGGGIKKYVSAMYGAGPLCVYIQLSSRRKVSLYSALMNSKRRSRRKILLLLLLLLLLLFIETANGLLTRWQLYYSKTQ